MSAILEDLKETVKSSSLFQARYKYDASIPGKDWFNESFWCACAETALNIDSVHIEDAAKSGKLIIVKRTYTEEIVGTYDITPEGTITPIRDQP